MFPTKAIISGIVLCAAGAIIILQGAALGLTPDMSKTIGAILALLGIIGFIVGLGGLVVLLKPPKGLHREDGAALAMALIRAMLAICIADGDVEEPEIQMIGKIYKQLTGSAISQQTIRDTADDMLANRNPIGDEMLSLKDALSMEMKLKVAKAAVYILAADGEMEAQEETILEEIRLGLGISAGKLKSIKNEILKSRGIAA